MKLFSDVVNIEVSTSLAITKTKPYSWWPFGITAGTILLPELTINLMTVQNMSTNERYQHGEIFSNEINSTVGTIKCVMDEDDNYCYLVDISSTEIPNKLLALYLEEDAVLPMQPAA